MNLVRVGDERPVELGGAKLALQGRGDAALRNGAGELTVGFRPEALHVGDGPLRAQIRTVEDLGSEVFVHVAIDHRGESVALVAKMAPPFDAEPGDTVGLQIIGTTHLFGGEGARIASSRATLE